MPGFASWTSIRTPSTLPRPFRTLQSAIRTTVLEFEPRICNISVRHLLTRIPQQAAGFRTTPSPRAEGVRNASLPTQMSPEAEIEARGVLPVAAG